VPPEQGRQVASPEVYEKNLRAIVARLKQSGAKLIFATTTLGARRIGWGRLEADAPRYNAVAVARDAGNRRCHRRPHAFVVPRQGQIQRPQNVQFTDAGSAQLADAVVASITPLLPPAAAKLSSSRHAPRSTAAATRG